MADVNAIYEMLSKKYGLDVPNDTDLEKKKLDLGDRLSEKSLAQQMSKGASAFGSLAGKMPQSNYAPDLSSEKMAAQNISSEQGDRQNLRDMMLKKYFAAQQAPDTAWSSTGKMSPTGELILQERSTGETKLGPKVKDDAAAAGSSKMNTSDKARLDNLNMSMKAINDLEEIFKKSAPGIVQEMAKIGDSPYSFAASRWSEAVGRMQSGGAINEGEAKSFKSLIPTPYDSKEMVRIKLDTMHDEIQSRFGTLGVEPPERQKTAPSVPDSESLSEDEQQELQSLRSKYRGK